jgi:hypothetical protein
MPCHIFLLSILQSCTPSALMTVMCSHGNAVTQQSGIPRWSAVGWVVVSGGSAQGNIRKICPGQQTVFGGQRCRRVVVGQNSRTAVRVCWIELQVAATGELQTVWVRTGRRSPRRSKCEHCVSSCCGCRTGTVQGTPPLKGSWTVGQGDYVCVQWPADCE